MSRAGVDGAGHERAHNPCRSDWEDVTADHAEPTAARWLLPTCAALLLVAIAAVLALTAF